MHQSQKPALGVSYFPTPGSRSAYSPLIGEGLIDALEWTIDSGLGRNLAVEDCAVLDDFASRGTLSGHGVHYSVLSAGGNKLRQKWLTLLKQDPWLSRYVHLSVHFGFSTAWKIAEGAPLPVPYSREALETGWRNLEALADVVPCPIGLENLALAFSKQDVENQGRFLDELLAPFDGFLLMDLHNLYCQSVNFGVDLMRLIKSYPLNRVAEIHISGGSWSGKIRRDTHDDTVPDILYDILPQVQSLCPHLRCIFLEQVPQALKNEKQQKQIKTDYMKLRECLHVAA